MTLVLWQALEAAKRNAFAAACQGSAADICKAVCLDVAAALVAEFPERPAGRPSPPCSGVGHAAGHAPDASQAARALPPPRIVAAVGHELIIEAAASEAAAVRALLALRLSPGTVCVGAAPLAVLHATVQAGPSLHPLGLENT